MKEEQLSTGYTVILQGVICSFIIILLGLMGFLLKNAKLDTTAWTILCCIIILVLIALIRLLSFADVYISSDQIVYKRVTGVKRRPLSEIRSVDEGILPFNYYLEFIDDKKVYFQLKPSDMLKRFSDSGSNNILNSLKQRLNLL